MPAPRRSLGHVTAPSGRLVLVDAGLLGRFDRARHASLLSPPGSTTTWELELDGVGAVAVAGLPPGARIEVLATPVAPGEDRWAAVDLEVQPDGSVAARRQVGTVPVDMARLIFIDASALSAWQHETPMDGLADLALWGADGAAVAAELQIPTLPDGTFGWTDVAADQALAWATHLEALREQGERRFAFDYRPHSHHHALMEQVRRSPVQSGLVEVGGATACGFMTTWGDGVFPVVAETDAHGGLVRLRIQLAEPPLAAVGLPAGGPAAGPAAAPSPVPVTPLPATPMEATAAALKTAARDAAQRRVEGWLYRQVKPYLPETVLKRWKKLAEDQASNLVWGCAFFVLFFGLAGGVVVLAAAMVAWSYLTR